MCSNSFGSDVELRFPDGTSLYAHSVLLSFGSSVLRQKLRLDGTTLIEMPNSRKEVWQVILNCLYPTSSFKLHATREQLIDDPLTVESSVILSVLTTLSRTKFCKSARSLNCNALPVYTMRRCGLLSNEAMIALRTHSLQTMKTQCTSMKPLANLSTTRHSSLSTTLFALQSTSIEHSTSSLSTAIALR